MNACRRHRWVVLTAALVVLALSWDGPRAGGQTTAPRAAGPGVQAGEAEARPVRQPPASGLEAKRLRKDAPPAGGGWLRTLGALAVVVGLILAARVLLRRLGGAHRIAGRGEAIEVLARATLSGRQQLSLVRLGRRLVLIGSSPSGMSSLAEFTDPAEVEELLEHVRSARRGSFAELFARYAGQSRRKGAPDGGRHGPTGQGEAPRGPSPREFEA